jgi:FkbM family methyltransferase
MMNSNSSYWVELTKEAFNASIGKSLMEIDSERFPDFKYSMKTRLRDKLFSFLFKKYFDEKKHFFINSLNENKDKIDKIFSLYELLADQYSKDLLIKVLSCHLYGHFNVKMSLNNQSYWKERKELENYIEGNEKIQTAPDFYLQKFNLKKAGYPIQLFYFPLGIHNTFILQQYLYKPQKIGVKNGDFVIDAGGCYGDTALYFAFKAGKTGRVFTFEFIPANLAKMKTNLALNPELKPNIEICPNPVWENSQTKMHYKDGNTGSHVSMESFKDEDGIVESVSIDDYVTKNNVSKIDFIKMDIEGAELKALKGAENTIKKFKPRLAIALYHNLNDFSEIPQYIQSLGMNYRFYIDHFTTQVEETMLFAE